jgi:hypothetical protein
MIFRNSSVSFAMRTSFARLWERTWFVVLVCASVPRFSFKTGNPTQGVVNVRSLVDEPPEPESKSEDIVVIRGRTADGAGLGVARLREGRVEVGVVQPLEDGKPIHGEVVKLKPRPACPIVCDVEKVALDSSPTEDDAAERSRTGPAQVATDRYRENWDAIWARPKKALPS